MSNNRQYTFFATAAPALEGLLASELETIGACEITQGRGSVSFKGELSTGYRVCLWTRIADRVLVQLITFSCAGREELYAAVRQFPWDSQFTAQNSFTIKADLVQSELTNSTFAAQVTKDAIADFFREKTGQQPASDNEAPELRLQLYIEQNLAILSLDISGSSLHQRTYRVKNVAASLKENIAAVLLLRAHWLKWAHAQETFVDPLCGSGTFAIEAAMMAADMAPGLLHPRFGSPAWLEHSEPVWQLLVAEAEKRKEQGLKNMPAIYALDQDEAAIAATTANVRQAGLSDYIRIIQADFHELDRQPLKKTPHGLIALNPPYGKRPAAGAGEQAATGCYQFYKDLGQTLYAVFPGWDVVMLTASEALTKSTGLRAHKLGSLYNGPIKCIAAYFYLTEERLYKGKKRKLTATVAAAGTGRFSAAHEAAEGAVPDETAGVGTGAGAREITDESAGAESGKKETTRPGESAQAGSSQEKTKTGRKKIIIRKIKKPAAATLPEARQPAAATPPEARQPAQPPFPSSGRPTAREADLTRIGSQTPAGLFINRLKRNLKLLRTWRKKEDISCYRLYDKDMPEFAVAIDVFEDKWVNVQEYVALRSIGPQKTASRLQLIIKILPQVLNVQPENVFLKARLQQKGRSQYNKLAEKKDLKIIREGGYKFYANFTDYLDVGIFLDHRPTRALIRKLASGKRFLNLYCYTGTATVYAAKGGTLKTISVDASNTYLSWARNNFLVNELELDENILICADCLEWLTQYANDKKQPFDLIFIDPPTFSNNKTKKRMFDIQKDYVGLLRLAASVLTSKGLIIFSTNFRKFIMEPELLPGLNVEDITLKTIPQDFIRNRRIHYCWQITKK